MSAAGLALMLGGAGLVLAASPAQAAEVSYATECVPPPISGLPPVQGTTKVELSAPAEAKVGDEIEVVWKTVEAASRNPDVLDLGKDTVKPTGTVTLGGAASGELKLEGPRQNPPIPKNSPMPLPDMTAKLKLEAAGEITLTPGAYTINVSKPISTDTKCAPKETVRPGATIKVTEAGSTTGGTTSGGADSGGTTSGGTTTTGGTDSGGTTDGGTTSGGGDTGGTATGGGDTAGTTAGGTTTGGSDSGGSSTGGTGGDTDFPGKEVSVAYACKTPIGDKNATSPVRISARKNGGAYDLTVKFSKSVMDSPIDISAEQVKPSMEVKLGGADKGTVTVEGPLNKEVIKTGAPIEIPDLTGTYKPGASGKSTLSPGVLTVMAAGTTTTCTPPADVAVSLELDTSAQPGGASGGTGSGGSTAGSGGSAASGGGTDSGGGLAATGAEDDGALRALGLVAGTAILLGGAVFTFTPWRRLRSPR
ncbi:MULTISPECIES: hypothetical protein [unclassified Streptomyces]|uniref:hypothetical protein n=1 Tax=unclassified Streptomyces TaxID=2593676 RepID=UPI00081E3709|nr:MULTISPECIES: hypothetical protein [unclassified Streptomyces]MYR96471.1 hypothetical protein [Streptomyces sp. SID4937]SCE10261.1 hypothetical protein GA0115243_106443 [Streptomyces sp. ScaeMP-e83]